MIFDHRFTNSVKIFIRLTKKSISMVVYLHDQLKYLFKVHISVYSMVKYAYRYIVMWHIQRVMRIKDGFSKSFRDLLHVLYFQSF